MKDLGFRSLGMGILKNIHRVLILALVICGFPLYASANVLVDQAEYWNYSKLSNDLWSDWANAGYNSFDWNNATWSNGQAAFGSTNATNGPYHTYWTPNTDLALMKSITINGSASDVVLNVASDNGFIIFINGNQVAKANAEGFTSIWEYSYSLTTSYLVNGNNIIQVLAEDHGGSTYFDMKLTATVNPVPLPPSALLIVPGLLGLFATRKKLKR